MSDNKKPIPLLAPQQAGKLCPVCGKRSYSRHGVHPQCAVRQADAPRQAKLAAERRAQRAVETAK